MSVRSDAVAVVADPPDPTSFNPGSHSANDIERTLHSFLNSTSLDQRLSIVRYPEATKAKMLGVLHPFAGRYFPDHQQLTTSPVLHESNVDRTSYSSIDVLLHDNSTRTAVFEITPEGPKLDWDSFVLYEPTSWQRFLELRPSEVAQFRVRAIPDDYFNFRYNDRTKYLCFKLSHPISELTCWGYVERNNPIAFEILQRLDAPAGMPIQPLQAILNLQFESFEDSDTAHHQVKITELVSGSWLRPQ